MPRPRSARVSSVLTGSLRWSRPSMTVMAAAAGADVNAWVDVSGPSGWAGVLLLDPAPRIERRDLPGLVVQARSDGEAEYAAARALARDRLRARALAG